MKTQTHQKQGSKSKSKANHTTQKKREEQPTSQFEDNRSQAFAQKNIQEIADKSPQIERLNTFQNLADNSIQTKQLSVFSNQRKDVSQKRTATPQKKEKVAVQQKTMSNSFGVKQLTDINPYKAPGTLDG